MSNPSLVWAQLSIPNPAAGSIPYVDTDNASIITDVLNLNYFTSSHELFAKYYQGDTLGTVAPLAGSIGEYQVTTGAVVALVNNTTINANSGLSLSPGDWDVEAIITFSPLTAATNTTVWQNSLSTASGVQGGNLGLVQIAYGSAGVFGGNSTQVSTAVDRFTLTAQTIIYPIALALFTGGAAQIANSSIRARRVR